MTFISHAPHAIQGSVLNATLQFIYQNVVFATYSIPEFSDHMSNKYRDQWSVSLSFFLAYEVADLGGSLTWL